MPRRWLPRNAPCLFAAISAKVGSIGDNRLGGWYSYRASKAALNQIVHTGAIELARSHKQSVCVTRSLHKKVNVRKSLSLVDLPANPAWLLPRRPVC